MAELWDVSKGITVYCLILAFISGTVLASFSGCVAVRIGTGESFMRGRSHCDACGHTLTIRELIPVLSWLVQRGHCRICGAKIPVICPVTELLEGAVFAALIWRYGFTPIGIQMLILAAILFLISLIDWETGIIPDRLILAGVIDFILFTFISAGWRGLLNGMLGGLMLGGVMLALTLIMDRILGRESMGGGDIKLFFMVGLFVSWGLLLMILIFSCVTGIIMNVLTAKTTGDPENPKAFPFAPSIAVGTVAALLWGAPILNWYLGLFI